MQCRDAAADVLVLLPLTRNKKKIMSFEIDFETEGFCGLELSCIDLVSHFDWEFRRFLGGLYWLDFVKVQNGKKENTFVSSLGLCHLVSQCNQCCLWLTGKLLSSRHIREVRQDCVKSSRLNKKSYFGGNRVLLTACRAVPVLAVAPLLM